MAIRTVFSTIEDCSQGRYLGWYEFLRDYAPLAEALLSHYFPALASDLDASVLDVFSRARAEGNVWFRSLNFANEGEFAMAFRDLVFTSGRTAAQMPAPGVSAEEILVLLDGLTLVQREFFWTFLKGWGVQQASAMLMDASATARQTDNITSERLSRLSPTVLAERSAIAIMAIEAAQSHKGAECLRWKTVNNLLNGQLSWSDREIAERHMSGCVGCVDAFTAFQEMIWLRRQAVPLPAEEVEALANKLNIRPPAAKGLLAKFLSRAS